MNTLLENKQQNSTVSSTKRRLTSAEFGKLSDVPPVIEWFGNLQNKRTRKAYQYDMLDFMQFTGITKPDEFRMVSRSHVIAWRESLHSLGFSAASIRRKLAALAALFDYLCEKNSINHNPVDGVKRPSEGSNEGKTPALSVSQARRLLNAPPTDTLKGLRDRAILSVLLYHGLRCDELCKLRIKDIQERSGVLHLLIQGKRSKIRYVPLHAIAQERTVTYLEQSKNDNDKNRPLFIPIKNNVTKVINKPLSSQAVYNIVKKYGKAAKIDMTVFSTHSLRATSATVALSNGADLAKVQQLLGHASVATTRLYDCRHMKPEDSAIHHIIF